MYNNYQIIMLNKEQTEIAVASERNKYGEQ